MSMRELDRLKCIQAVVDGELYPGIAAERLGISIRQLRRIAQRYRAEGPTGLISKHWQSPGPKKDSRDCGLKHPERASELGSKRTF